MVCCLEVRKIQIGDRCDLDAIGWILALKPTNLTKTVDSICGFCWGLRFTNQSGPDLVRENSTIYSLSNLVISINLTEWAYDRLYRWPIKFASDLLTIFSHRQCST